MAESLSTADRRISYERPWCYTYIMFLIYGCTSLLCCLPNVYTKPTMFYLSTLHVVLFTHHKPRRKLTETSLGQYLCVRIPAVGSTGHLVALSQ